MSKIRTHAVRALEEQGIPYRLVIQAHKARNVEQAAAERGVPPRGIVKTLLVRRPDACACATPGPAPQVQAGTGGRHVIALVRGDQRLSLKKLARLIGAKSLDMAPADDVPRITGYQIGAVAPVGLRRSDVPIYVDRHILEESTVSISAGRHDAGLELTTSDLIRAVAGQVADITE